MVMETVADCHFCGGKIRRWWVDDTCTGTPRIVFDCEKCGEIILFNHFRTKLEAEKGAVSLWNSYRIDQGDGDHGM